ncbi:hypothetical protein HYH03_018366 [Edaphochlamys debaryana]|uniref:Uncharacterized protein n=1 Tax=Edaphochlamys debaryana TaxID=47281 RepID=A0A836BPG3_9CHLO|nr:hypothetical protein HYH03_018366 [Edaphochlamys debaryana]|eukprot:KAG2482709.1 hypothetical protein HYH03_018366 [Edaphochlamys debaryana]
MQAISASPAMRVGPARVSRRPRAVRVEASIRPQVVDESHVGPSRRGLLALAAGAVVSMASPAVRPAFAGCSADAEDGDQSAACFQQLLAKDVDAVKDARFKTEANRSFTAAANVPVASLDSEFARATLKLRERIISYATSDLEDYKNRVPLIKELKIEAAEWVSKYARGGNVRSDSARRMYIAVDAVVGHLASQGYAAMPKAKLTTVLKNLDQAKDFLEQGK